MKMYIIISMFFLFIGTALFSQNAKQKIIKTISSEDGYKLIEANKSNPDFIIIDVRTPGEFSDGHIEKAVNVDFNDKNFEKNINALDKNKTYAIYCRSGNRSGQALKVMERLGFKEVYNFGGITDWTRAGYKTVK